MAELNDVLGAILRDIAQARVTGDLFSRNASLDYRRDELLRGFPVPRVEIKEASVQLRFAVSSVERRETDPRAVIQAQIAPFATRLGRQAYSDLIETDPRGDELTEIIARKGLALQTRLPAVIEATLSANIAELEAAVAGRPETLARKLQGEVAGLLLADDDVKDVLTRPTRVGDLRERVSVAAAASLAALARELPRGDAPGRLSRDTIAAAAARLADEVHADLVLANPRRSELQRAASEAGVSLDRELRDAAEKALLDDPEALEAALERDPDALAEKLEADLTGALLRAPNVRDVLTSRVRVTDLRTRVATLAATSLAGFVPELRAAIEAAERQALSVEVAVATKDLADVPETMISQVTVTSEIRNYEWVETGEPGATTFRLEPE
jgi:hypothetical protein